MKFNYGSIILILKIKQKIDKLSKDIHSGPEKTFLIKLGKTDILSFLAIRKNHLSSFNKPKYTSKCILLF